MTLLGCWGMGTNYIAEPESVKLDRANIVGVRPAYDGKAAIVYNSAIDASVVIYTVPASTIFLLCDWSVNYRFIASGTYTGYLQLLNNSSAHLCYLSLLYGGVHDDDKRHHAEYYIPWTLPAGYQLKIHSSSANLQVAPAVHGIEMQV